MTPPKSPPVPATTDRPPGSEPENAPPEAESADRNPPGDDGIVHREWPIGVPVRERRQAMILGAFIAFAGILAGWAMHPKPRPVEAPEAGTVVVTDTIRADSAFNALVDRVAAEEGFRSHPYEDAGGTVAVGYGTNLTTGGLTEAQARELLESGLADRMRRLAGAWPPFAGQPKAIRYALTDAAYQLGVSGLMQFHHLLSALEAGDAPAAVEAVRSSAWHGQTPDRAERLISVIRRTL